jgi:hypothetical protein
MWKPLHRQPAFAGCTVYGGATAERLFARGVALPSGSALDAAQRARVAETLRAFLERRAPLADPVTSRRRSAARKVPVPAGPAPVPARPLRAVGAP